MEKTKHKRLSVGETLNRAGLTLEQVLRRSIYDTGVGVPACCTCGAYVEPDGKCPHGHPSVLLKEGLV